MRLRRVAVVAMAVVVATVVSTACRSSSQPRVARLTVDGQAEVSRPGEDRHDVTTSRSLRPGDRVRVLQGTAVVQLPGDRRIELRRGSDLDLQATAVKDTVRPVLLAGDALVSSSVQPFTVDLTGAQVSVRGAARASRGQALLVATYEGSADLRAGDRSITVAALRQAAIPATGMFPARVTPLEYSPSDLWDQRFLSDAMALGDQLNGRSRGFTAQFGPSDGRTVTFFRDLLPRLAAQPAFDAALLGPPRPPGETLVGAAIALEGSRGTFAERWVAIFRFHDEGAPWGLVADDQGVGGTALLATIDGAVGRGPAMFAEAPPGQGRGLLTPTTRPATTPSPTAPPPPTTVPRGGAAPPSTAPTTTAPPATSPGPLNTGNPVVDNTVNSLVDTLTGLLKGLGGQ